MRNIVTLWHNILTNHMIALKNTIFYCLFPFNLLNFKLIFLMVSKTIKMVKDGLKKNKKKKRQQKATVMDY